MFNYNFKQRTTFKSSLELQKALGINDLSLEEGSSVEFKGEISIYNNISFKGNCIIETGVSIENGSILENVNIGKGSTIRPYSIIRDSKFGLNNIIGPFCFIRDNTSAGDNCILGSHVEIARSKLGNNIKISHQAYIGDASICDDSIIGAGSIFCNFDGTQRQNSFIDKNVIIGSGTLIVSPINIGQKSVIGAGSIITKNIKPNSLIIQKR